VGVGKRVVDLVGEFGRLGADDVVLLALAPVEGAPVEAVAGGADRLEDHPAAVGIADPGPHDPRPAVDELAHVDEAEVGEGRDAPHLLAGDRVRRMGVVPVAQDGQDRLDRPPGHPQHALDAGEMAAGAVEALGPPRQSRPWHSMPRQVTSPSSSPAAG